MKVYSILKYNQWNSMHVIFMTSFKKRRKLIQIPNIKIFLFQSDLHASYFHLFLFQNNITLVF